MERQAIRDATKWYQKGKDNKREISGNGRKQKIEKKKKGKVCKENRIRGKKRKGTGEIKTKIGQKLE